MADAIRSRRITVENCHVQIGLQSCSDRREKSGMMDHRRRFYQSFKRDRASIVNQHSRFRNARADIVCQ